MKKLFLFLLIICVAVSCNSPVTEIHLDDPIEAGREFIEASLAGNYDLARKYIVTDSLNIMYLERLEDFNNKLDQKEKDGYKNANIIINPTKNISDSELIINYSNTYKNQPSMLKMVRQKDGWRVDFKYTFSGDSTPVPLLK